jgi:hypothetical protein
MVLKVPRLFSQNGMSIQPLDLGARLLSALSSEREKGGACRISASESHARFEREVGCRRSLIDQSSAARPLQVAS